MAWRQEYLHIDSEVRYELALWPLSWRGLDSSKPAYNPSRPNDWLKLTTSAFNRDSFPVVLITGPLLQKTVLAVSSLAVPETIAISHCTYPRRGGQAEWPGRGFTLRPTLSNSPSRDTSVPLRESYCTYHFTDSARTTAGLLPLLVSPPGTVFRTLSIIRSCFQVPAKDIFVRTVLAHGATPWHRLWRGTLQKVIKSHYYNRAQHNVSLLMWPTRRWTVFRGSSIDAHVCLMLTPGNGLFAQIGIPITRLPVEYQLSRGQSLGPEDRWILAARVPKTRQQWRGYSQLINWTFLFFR